MQPLDTSAGAVGPAKVLWPVVEGHLDAAEYLASQWERGFDSPSLTLERMADLEERLLANIDGLECAGVEACRRFLASALQREADSEAFVSALAILRDGAPGASEFLVDVLRGGPLARPILRALALAPASAAEARGPVEKAVAALLTSDTGGEVAWGLEVLAFRGSAMPEEVEPLLGAREPGVAAAALRAARPHASRFATHVRRGLASPVGAIRDAAIEAGALLGLADAYEAAKYAVQSRHLVGPVPLWLVGLAAGDDLRLLEGLLGDAEWGRHALFAMGLSGRPRAIDACMPLLHHQTLGSFAAEAFSMVSGVRVEGALRRLTPYVEPPSFEEDDLDANLVPPPEAALPKPEPEAVQRAWESLRGGLGESRYFQGEGVDGAALARALERSPMRWRHAMALEVAIRTSGRVALETRGWTARQMTPHLDLGSGELRPLHLLLTASAR